MSYEDRSYIKKVQRTKQVKKQITILVLTFLAVITLAILFGSFFSKAKSDTDISEYKYYTTIQVAYGDTLTEIAQEYLDHNYDSLEEYIDEVKKMNHLRDDSIQAGQYLLVPYFSSEFIL